MSEESDKFCAAMLEQAKKKEVAKPQSRTEGVDRTQVEKLTELLLNPKNRKK